jgi:hypothetical protein
MYRLRLARMAHPTPLSSRGLGRRILSPETGVRIPVAVSRSRAVCRGLADPAAPDCIHFVAIS